MTARRRTEPIPALAPLGRVFLAVAAIRNRLYDARFLRSRHVGIPTICVGNVTAGGTGKTPIVLWLLARLSAAGRRVGVVSRGYGGRRAHEPLVVARGATRFASPAESGDEAALVAQTGQAHVVVVGSDRVRAAECALHEDADVLLLDDGFQHRRLARDLDIVLCDHADPLGGGRGVPAGLLREYPARAFARAGLLVVTRAPADLAARPLPLEQAELPQPLRSMWGALPPARRPPVVAAGLRADVLVGPGASTQAATALTGRRVLVVSGVAHPASVVAMVRASGAIVAEHLAFGDHHAFDEADAATIASRARAANAEIIVTTSKDRVRWPPSAPEAHVLAIQIVIGAEEFVMSRIEHAIQRAESKR